MVEKELALKDNVVWLDKNQFIHVVYHGDQTLEQLRAVLGELQRLCNELAAQDKPVLIIADIRDMGKHKAESRLIGMRARSQLPFWRMAIVTSRTYDETVAVSHKLTAMSSRKREIGYFISLPAAHRWLNELAQK